MIKQQYIVRQLVKVLTWEGDEHEARTFAPEYFIGVHEGDAIFTTFTGTVVRVPHGYRVFLLENGTVPFFMAAHGGGSEYDRFFEG